MCSMHVSFSREENVTQWSNRKIIENSSSYYGRTSAKLPQSSKKIEPQTPEVFESKQCGRKKIIFQV